MTTDLTLELIAKLRGRMTDAPMVIVSKDDIAILLSHAEALMRLEDALAENDLLLAKMSQEQGNAEPPPGWIVQIEKDAMCGEVDVLAKTRGLTLSAAILSALAKAEERR